MEKQLTVLGAGSMAEALIAGWTNTNDLAPEQIMVSNRQNDARLEQLEKDYGVRTSRSARELCGHGEIIILACKPKDWLSALEPVVDSIGPQHTLVSVMAGITTEQMENQFSFRIPVIRAIPNTSAVVNEAMTPFASGRYINESTKKAVTDWFKLVGQIEEVEEHLMDAMTAITGTGPAYIYYLMESMELAAEKVGIDRDTARKLVAQTLLGAGIRVQSNETPPRILYEQIMSPQGTTEAGFTVLHEADVQQTMIKCIERASERSKELGGIVSSGVGPNNK
ncbi:pyrroline-5-carboxylate reductase [Salisediminibacterium halotolerans]|uniref:Pyrroline-5-carboxylate reductase n=1 Tax=Salisediminibacterium halotolerans TaxID=517425 RepID=A0A1H9PBX4_9BACI|nr:pyrroline-5-carboxylate reductase [Salisediminibacterium haloalkalitolerans]SER45652.1 pyrroline-5-carboxylate reductase [Salisediminibacterium haloalkalitolerans]